jgi:hypothetical protein
LYDVVRSIEYEPHPSIMDVCILSLSLAACVDELATESDGLGDEAEGGGADVNIEGACRHRSGRNAVMMTA